MPEQLTPADVKGRLRDFPTNTYVFVGAVNKGIALAFSIYTLLYIIGAWKVYGHRLPFWFASMMGLLVYLPPIDSARYQLHGSIPRKLAGRSPLASLT